MASMASFLYKLWKAKVGRGFFLASCVMLSLFNVILGTSPASVNGEDLLGLRFQPSSSGHGAGILLASDNRKATFIGTPKTGSEGRGGVALIGSPMCSSNGHGGVFTVAIRMAYDAPTGVVAAEAGMASKHSLVAAVLDSGTRVRQIYKTLHMYACAYTHVRAHLMHTLFRLE